MSARIDGADFDRLAEAIRPLDTEQARDAYRSGNFPNADRVKDLDVRYRWDLYWAAGSWRIRPEGVHDAHIDTALRRIVPPLAIEVTS